MLQEREVVPLMQGLLEDGYTGASGDQRRAAAGARSRRSHQDRRREMSGFGRGRYILHGEPRDAFALPTKLSLCSVAVPITNSPATLPSGIALRERVNAVLFSPAFRKDAAGARDSSHCLLDPQELAEWMIADNVPARLGLQLHKFIWNPALKGV